MPYLEEQLVGQEALLKDFKLEKLRAGNDPVAMKGSDATTDTE